MDHPNVIKFLGGCSDPPHLHMVTEIMKSGSLWDVLHDEKRYLSGDLRLRMALEIAAGMTYLHQRNVLHRDLKSENILVSQSFLVSFYFIVSS